jgi:tetratricopeptide (TPR) repeat protein
MVQADKARRAFDDIFSLINSGRFEHAEKRCKSYLEGSPDDINVLGLLGVVLLRVGKITDAKPVLEKTIRLEPKFAKPHEDLGMLCLHEGKPERAVQYFEEAIRLDGSQAGAYAGLAKALTRLGEHEAANEAEKRHLELSPIARALAQASKHLAAGQTTEAEEVCDNISKQHPANTDILRMQARIAAEDGRHIIAEGLLKRIIKLSPGDYRPYVDLGRFLGERDRYPEGVDALKQAVALEPSVVASQQMLADFLSIVGQPSAALEIYEAVLKLDPDYSPALVGRGHMLRILGRRDEAVIAYESAIAVRPDVGHAWWSLASLRNYRFSTEQVDEMRAQVNSASESDKEMISFHFALARACEDDDDFDGAWQHYVLGNSLKREAVRYDPVEIEISHDKIADFFTAEFFELNDSEASDGPAPIFIVGMPRSGSTLLEQILASHSQVEGAAELPYLAILAESLGSHRFGGKRYPEGLAEMTAEQLTSLGKSYVYHSKRNRPENLPRFTDKMPANFAHIGLIHLALPNAKIIDARRHPLDTCVGNYRQLFAKGKNHAYDLYECAEYYQEYVRLMAHWDEVLPGRVLKVQYEDVVADIEGQSRRMLEYCELPWEDACLTYYETGRPVNTASSEQVREPVFDDAVGYWKNFESELAEVKEILAYLL